MLFLLMILLIVVTVVIVAFFVYVELKNEEKIPFHFARIFFSDVSKISTLILSSCSGMIFDFF